MSGAGVQSHDPILVRFARVGVGYWALLAGLAVLVGLGVYAYATQLSEGLAVTGVNDRVFWGAYVASFVFLVGVAMSTALLAAFVRLSGVAWGAPFVRVAEAVTVAALTVAAIVPVMDLGRPDRLLNLVLFGRWKSPAVWDLIVLTSFLAAAVVALYLPLIPDLALCRDRLAAAVGAPRRWLHGILGVGWAAAPPQRRHLAAAVRTVNVLMVLLALAAYAVTTSVLGMALPGGAQLSGVSVLAVSLVSGVAVAIVVLAGARRSLGLRADPRPFVTLGRVLAALGVATVALDVSRLLVDGTAAPQAGALHTAALGPLGWAVPASLLLPAVPAVVPALRRAGPIVATALIAAAGTWLERLASIVGGLGALRSPFVQLGGYVPTWVELGVTIGLVALFALLLAFAAKLVPLVALEGDNEHSPASRPTPSRLRAARRRIGTRIASQRPGGVRSARLVRRGVPAVTAAAVVVIVLGQAGLLAHPQREPVIEEAPEPPQAEPVEEAVELPEPALRLYPPVDAVLGEEILIEALLLEPDGTPVPDAVIAFTTTVAWAGYVHGEVVVGTASTDAEGFARVRTTPKTAGHAGYGARFDGNTDLQPASADDWLSVRGTTQLYTPDVDRGPSVWWLTGALVGVWGVLLLAAGRVFHIAHAAPGAGSGRCPFTGATDRSRAGGRRRFLGRFVAPAALGAAALSLGTGLLTLVTRSARAEARPGSAGWSALPPERRPAVAQAARWSGTLRPLPPVLEREVSFADEVLPILLRKGGPHVHRPRHSPVPHHVHLDSYAAIVDGHGDHGPTHALVVPGEPLASRLVTVLLDPTMQMPPGVGMPDEEIQLIASWVAQGAKDN